LLKINYKFFFKFFFLIKLIKLMGNDINNFCNCKEISDAFNPDLEDVFIII